MIGICYLQSTCSFVAMLRPTSFYLDVRVLMSASLVQKRLGNFSSAMFKVFWCSWCLSKTVSSVSYLKRFELISQRKCNLCKSFWTVRYTTHWIASNNNRNQLAKQLLSQNQWKSGSRPLQWKLKIPGIRKTPTSEYVDPFWLLYLRK